MARKLLDLADTKPVAVFRAIEAILRGDESLQTLVKGDCWQTWDGTEASLGPLPPNADVAVRLTPIIQGNAWFSPDCQAIDLVVFVDYEIASTCQDDGINFWQAVLRAFYPADDPAILDEALQPRSAIRRALTDAGAQTGEFWVIGPSVLPAGEDDESPSFLTCRGGLKCKVWNPLNSVIP